MPTPRLLAALAAAALALGPASARAGFPGAQTAKEFQHSTLRYVCSNQLQTQCPVDPNNADLLTSQCPANPAPTCIPDAVPNADIRALLTVISDDDTPQPVASGETSNTVILEFKIGNDSYALADAFRPQGNIGDWFDVPSEADIYHFDFSGGALLSGSLTPLRTKLLEIGQQRLGVPASNVTPVVVEGLFDGPSGGGGPKPQELGTNQSLVANGSQPGQPLASIARYRVTIKFIRTP